MPTAETTKATGDGPEYVVLLAPFDDDKSASTAWSSLVRVARRGAGIQSAVTLHTDARGTVQVLRLMENRRAPRGARLAASFVAWTLLPRPRIISVVVLALADRLAGRVRSRSGKASAAAALLGAFGPSTSGLLAIVKATDAQTAAVTLPAGTTYVSGTAAASLARSLMGRATPGPQGQ